MSFWYSLISIFVRQPLIISSVCRQLSFFFAECLGFFWNPICTLSCSCSYSASRERLLQTCCSGFRKVFFALQVQRFFLVCSFVRWQVWKELLKGCLGKSNNLKSESRKKKKKVTFCRSFIARFCPEATWKSIYWA